MKLWLISQNENNGYDTYDSAVVAAETETEARNILPGSYLTWEYCYNTWVDSPDRVTVELIGEAIDGTKTGVILASFNAG